MNPLKFDFLFKINPGILSYLWIYDPRKELFYSSDVFKHEISLTHWNFTFYPFGSQRYTKQKGNEKSQLKIACVNMPWDMQSMICNFKIICIQNPKAIQFNNIELKASSNVKTWIFDDIMFDNQKIKYIPNLNFQIFIEIVETSLFLFLILFFVSKCD